MKNKKYETPAAFRKALEDRLMNQAMDEGSDIQRLRRQVAFDRFLCRLFACPVCAWILKGGYAMELRMNAARTTKDIDLGFMPKDQNASFSAQDQSIFLSLLQDAVNADIHDNFGFQVQEAMLEFDVFPDFGFRFPVTAYMAGRVFARFHVDVSSGNLLVKPRDYVEGKDWLAFANIEPMKFPVITEEEQFAEKIHAYTRPRKGVTNSRVKDIIDMVLLIDKGTVNKDVLADVIRKTFKSRDTHQLQHILPEPPIFWAETFAVLAHECGINEDINEQFDKCSRYLIGVL